MIKYLPTIPTFPFTDIFLGNFWHVEPVRILKNGKRQGRENKWISQCQIILLYLSYADKIKTIHQDNKFGIARFEKWIYNPINNKTYILLPEMNLISKDTNINISSIYNKHPINISSATKTKKKIK